MDKISIKNNEGCYNIRMEVIMQPNIYILCTRMVLAFSDCFIRTLPLENLAWWIFFALISLRTRPSSFLSWRVRQTLQGVSDAAHIHCGIQTFLAPRSLQSCFPFRTGHGLENQRGVSVSPRDWRSLWAIGMSSHLYGTLIAFVIISGTKNTFSLLLEGRHTISKFKLRERFSLRRLLAAAALQPHPTASQRQAPDP